jgi:hypothetical protein
MSTKSPTQLNDPCVRFFQQPATFIAGATSADWTLLLHQSRDQALLGSMYALCQHHQLLKLLPAVVYDHFWSGFVYAEKQKVTLVQELLELEQCFSGADYRCVLVKGCAYRLGLYQFARGRIFSDIDLLVPAQHFTDALARLQDAGYLEFEISDYDRRYYQRWSHQNPPLTHFLRGAGVDLHHHIFPVSSREKILVEPLIAAAEPLAHSVFSLPSPAFLFVHAAVHLFYQEESHKLVKDLVDLQQLYLEVCQRQSVTAIVDAAEQSQAQAAVFYALDMLQWLFQLSIPAAELQTLQPFAADRRRRYIRFLLQQLLKKQSFWHRSAHLLWFIRGHLLKMGPTTLLYHSVAKALLQFKLNRKTSKEQQLADKQTRPQDAGQL